MIVGNTAPVEEGDRRRPDHTVGAEVGLVGGVVKEEAQRHEPLGDKGGHLGIGIRHGIQGDAARSVLLAEVGQDEAPLTGRPLHGGLKVCFPGESHRC